MKNSLKKIPKLILPLCMLMMLLSVMTFTVSADEENKEYKILELSGQVTASTISDHAACNIVGDTTLILDGTKTIEKICNDKGNPYSLTIRGSGTLNTGMISLSGGNIHIESGKIIVENFKNSYGVYGDSVYITGGNIILKNGRTGIYANHDLAIAGGTIRCEDIGEYCIYNNAAINITGGSLTCANSCIGIGSSDYVDISDGKITIADCFYSGIDARCVRISDGQVDITFSGVSEEDLLVMGISSVDLYSSGVSMEISGGKININGCDVGIYSDNLNITGGDFIINSTRAAILSQKDMNIDDRIVKSSNLKTKTLTKAEAYRLLNGGELPQGREYFTLKSVVDEKGNAAKKVTAGVDETVNSGWRKNNAGWWYLNADGTYPKNTWKKISGKWYHFDAGGYMQTGWYKEGTTWYYLKTNGTMAANEWIDNGKYYVDGNGKWIKDKKKVTAGWKKDSKGWWYQNADGTYPKDTWKKISGKWYHFDANGYMQIGWYKEGKNYYYLKADGQMAVDEWVDNGRYYVDSQGRWVQ